MGLTTGEIVGIVVVVVTLLVFGIWIFIKCCKSCYRDIKETNDTTREISFVKNLQNSFRRSFGRVSQRNVNQNKETSQQMSSANGGVSENAPNAPPSSVPVTEKLENLKQEKSELHPCFMKKDPKQSVFSVSSGQLSSESQLHHNVSAEQGYVKVVTQVPKPHNPPAHFQDNAPKDGELVRDKKHATEGYTTKEVFEGIVFKKKEDRVQLCAEKATDEDTFGGVEYQTENYEGSASVSKPYNQSLNPKENTSAGFDNPVFNENNKPETSTSSQPTFESEYARPNNTILFAGDIVVNTTQKNETREVFFDDFVNSQNPKTNEEQEMYNV